MKPAFIKPSPLFSSLTILLLSIHSAPSISNAHSHGDQKPYYKCAPFECGIIKNIRYPFWGNGQPEYCGQPGFKIDCEETKATIEISSIKHQVIEINLDSQTLRIARMDLMNSACPAQYIGSALNSTLFKFTPNDENATLFYDCHLSEDHETANRFNCSFNNTQREARLVSPLISGSEFELGCNSSVMVPILAKAVVGFLRPELSVVEVLKEGFEVKWSLDQVNCRICTRRGGRCGYNWTVNQFKCFIPSDYAEFSHFTEISSGMYTFCFNRIYPNYSEYSAELSFCIRMNRKKFLMLNKSYIQFYTRKKGL